MFHNKSQLYNVGIVVILSPQINFPWLYIVLLLRKSFVPWGESTEWESHSKVHILWFHFTLGQKIETILKDKIFKLSFSQNHGII